MPVVCCEDHPRATLAEERRRSSLDAGSRKLSVDAGDGDDDDDDGGEDEDGRGGGRRKRTRNVMGNIRNYDIDQKDAQTQNRRRNSTLSSFISFVFADKQKGGRMEKILAKTRHGRRCAQRFASCSRGGTRPIGGPYAPRRH